MVALMFPLANASPGDTSKVILRFAGDVLLGGHYERVAGTDVDRAFRNFTLFRTADFSLVNLENPVTTRGAKVPKEYNFRMHPRYVQSLANAGISTVSLANNHIFDYGREGLEDTFRWLDSAGIRYVGAGRNTNDAHTPLLFRKGRHVVALLAYYGGGEAPAATKSTGGVARRDLRLAARDIGVAREKGG